MTLSPNFIFHIINWPVCVCLCFGFHPYFLINYPFQWPIFIPWSRAYFRRHRIIQPHVLLQGWNKQQMYHDQRAADTEWMTPFADLSLIISIFVIMWWFLKWKASKFILYLIIYSKHNNLNLKLIFGQLMILSHGKK